MMVMYPTFLKYTGQQYEELAYGILPHGISIEGSNITIGEWNGPISKCKKELSAYLRRHNTYPLNDWGKIRIKNIRDSLLEEYVVSLPPVKNWTKDRILRYIQLNISFQNIGRDDVQMEDGRIAYIEGFDEGKIPYYENVPPEEETYVASTIKRNPSLRWSKLCSQVQKLML